MNWIMSEGGPLICLEKILENSWGGINNLTVECVDAATDYERACQIKEYGETLPLATGSALILTGPLDTAFCCTPSGILLIARFVYAEADVNEEEILGKLTDSIFLCPIEVIDISFTSSTLSMFDSAYPGDDPSKKAVSFEIKPGNYRILTQEYEPDEQTSMLLHRLQIIP